MLRYEKTGILLHRDGSFRTTFQTRRDEVHLGWRLHHHHVTPNSEVARATAYPFVDWQLTAFQVAVDQLLECRHLYTPGLTPMTR